MFDFKSIPRDLKNYLITILVLPFWYISIYYYFPSIYNQDDFLLISSICLALSVMSNFATSVIVMAENEDKDVMVFDLDVVIPVTFIQCAWLSILIFGGYLTNKFAGLKFDFYGFLLSYFGGYLVYCIISIIYHKQNKNNR